jgi:hypothetical protein
LSAGLEKIFVNKEIAMEKIFSPFKKKLWAFLIGILMNPILFTIVLYVDSAPSNMWLNKPLLERTPFAYIFYWSSVFLPGNPPNLELELLLAIISNTILYFTLSYILLNRLGCARVN